MTNKEATIEAIGPDIYRTKAEIVHARLREQILSGGLAPGQRVTLAALAKQLDVSVMPIRDAIARLEREGLVVTTRHKDIHITDLAIEDITQLFAIRASLEALATRLALSNGGAVCLVGLVAADSRMRAAHATQDFQAMADANWEFHRAIVAAAANPHLARMLEDVWARCFRFRLGYKLIPGRAEKTFDEHAAIIAAMRSGDAAGVASAAEAHVARAADDLLKLIEGSGRAAAATSNE